MKFLIRELHAHIKELTLQQLGPADWALPPDRNLGDIAIPCFKLAKALGKAPPVVAQDLAQKIAERVKSSATSSIQSISVAGPYLNVFFKEASAFERLRKSLVAPTPFGGSGCGTGKTIAIDFSSPNVAKEIALHHLRSTAIGNSLARIATLHGYKVERINYLGDWGTSFGKLICGLSMLGKEDELDRGGLSYMLDIYVRFNKAEKDNPELTRQARAAFKKLEDGDPDCRRIWKLFREISIREFKILYDRLGISFDHFDGESLYVDAIEPVVREIDSKIGTRSSEGALVCDLPGHKIPILLRKDDGASLYITRDVAAAEDRFRRFHYDESWYVVAVQQKLHFQQLFDLLKALQKPYANRVEHIPFGMLAFGSKTMKSREGNVIFLKDVLDEAKSRALEIIRAKNPDLSNAEEVAEMIGMGAILFNDLSQNRVHDISFDWEKALSFEGDTSPFIQYAHARSASLIKKCKAHLPTLKDPGTADDLAQLWNETSVRQLVGDLWYFEIYCERALDARDPSQIAASLIAISKALNQLYHKVRFLQETKKNRLETLVQLSECVKSVLAQGLGLLGISAPDEM